MIVQHVDTNFIQSIWSEIAPLIGESIARSGGDFDVGFAKYQLIYGGWQLIVFTEDSAICGVATIEYINRPNDRVAFVTALGGKNIVDEDSYQQLVLIVKQNGATVVQGACRPSVIKLLKNKLRAKEKFVVIEVEV